MGEEGQPKLRILYVITKASWGGAQRYVYDLAVSAKAQGHDVSVVYGEEGPLKEALASENIPAIRLPSLARDINLKEEWKSFKALKQFFEGVKPDILHVNSSKAGLSLVAARLAKVPKIIFTAHGWAFNEARPWWQKLVFRLAYATTIYLSHITICVSQAVFKDMEWLPFASRRLFVIKLGIDAPVFMKRTEARKKFGELGSRIVLGMLAELHPTKRVEDAIRALRELKPDFPNLMLIVCGEGSERAHLSELIEHLRLADSVVLKGFVPDAATYMKAFDIFLMISRTEALGYAAIEAGYAGLPVVATRVGGLPEIVRHKETGLLVPAENPHALARALRLLLEQHEYAQHLSTRLHEHVTEKFTKERMLKETFVLYT